MKDEIIRKWEELIENQIKFLSNLEAKVCFGLSTSENKTIINERIYSLESELAELKAKESQRANIEKVMALDEDDGLYNSDEPQPDQSAKNMKILSEMANQDELLSDMELKQSAEERPKIEDYFKKGVTMSEVHKEYTGSPVLFKYAQALDSYIDEWINKWKGE